MSHTDLSTTEQARLLLIENGFEPTWELIEYVVAEQEMNLLTAKIL
jgi:hypothetical protein